MDDPVGQPVMELFDELCWNSDVDIERWDRKFSRDDWQTDMIAVRSHRSSGSWELRGAPAFGAADVRATKIGMRFGGSSRKLSWRVECFINVSLPINYELTASEFAENAASAIAQSYGYGTVSEDESNKVESFVADAEFPEAVETKVDLKPKGRQVTLRFYANLEDDDSRKGNSRPESLLQGLTEVGKQREGRSASATELVNDFLKVCVQGNVTAREMTKRAREQNWLVTSYTRKLPHKYSSRAVFNPPEFCPANITTSEYTRESRQNGRMPLRTCELEVSYYCRNKPNRHAPSIGRTELDDALDKAGFKVEDSISDSIVRTLVLSHPQAGAGKKVEFVTRHDNDAGGWLKTQVTLPKPQ